MNRYRMAAAAAAAAGWILLGVSGCSKNEPAPAPVQPPSGAMTDSGQQTPGGQSAGNLSTPSGTPGTQ